MWADPCDIDTDAVNLGFRDNSTRGCSSVFGLKAVKPFLTKNKFVSIFRAHEAQLEGFKMHKWEKSVSFPPVITIFSAPNYCDVYNNKGAVLKLKDNTLNLQQFNCWLILTFYLAFKIYSTGAFPLYQKKVSFMIKKISLGNALSHYQSKFRN